MPQTKEDEATKEVTETAGVDVVLDMEAVEDPEAWDAGNATINAMNMVVDGNNNNSSLDYSAASIIHDCHATELLCLGMKRASRLLPKWLLMDSCSTVHLICDKELLTNVHDVKQDITVHCNVGAIKLTQMGYLGDFPTPVWYHPQGIANIMSMDDVATQFQMTLNSQTSNALCLHSLNGKCIALCHQLRAFTSMC